MATIDKGTITYSDEGRISDEVTSTRHGVIVSVDYSIDATKKLMSYTVYIGETFIRNVEDEPYSYYGLHSVALETFYRNMYKGLPNLTIQVNEGIE